MFVIPSRRIWRGTPLNTGWWRVMAIAVVGVVLVPPSSSAQESTASTTRHADCTAGSWDYLGCALVAGGISALSDQPSGPVIRELRFWSVAGNMMPERLLIIREYADSVTGNSLFLWRRSPSVDSFVMGRCAAPPNMNDIAGICRAPVRLGISWTEEMARLDSLEIFSLPANPVPHDPCRSGLQSDGTYLACGVAGDGWTETVEYLSRGVYWRYTIDRMPDRRSPLAERDAAIAKVFRCAASANSEGPCSKS